MRSYELTLILEPEEDLNVDSIGELVAQKGGSVNRVEDWGRK
jgi:ribosomal protein S6